MDRREFIKLCSMAGLGVASAQLPGTYLDAKAAVGPSTGWFFFNATGGWDIFRVADPKGDATNSKGFAVSPDIPAGSFEQVGNITYPAVGNNSAFFTALGPYMTVINGIDCETNSHETGQQNTFSGRLQQNSPALAALIAAAHGGAKPLSFITNGGYDSTFGVPVSKTRLGDTNTLMPLIYPNVMNIYADDLSTAETYHTDETFSRIIATRQARLEEMQNLQHLPLVKRKMNLLYTAREGMGELKGIIDYLPPNDVLNQLGDLERQAAIALAAFKAGLCQTAALTVGGFDSHANNAPQQDNQRSQLFAGMMYFMQRAEELGVLEDVAMVAGSDFGRTPQDNGAQGKDHWNVGTMMFIDPSGQVPGGRVFGATDDAGDYVKVDANGQPGGSIVMKNSTVHGWMRKHAGIEDNEVVRLFPLQGTEEIDFG